MHSFIINMTSTFSHMCDFFKGTTPPKTALVMRVGGNVPEHLKLNSYIRECTLILLHMIIPVSEFH